MSVFRYSLAIACIIPPLCWLAGEDLIQAFDMPRSHKDDASQVIVCPRPSIEATFVFNVDKGMRDGNPSINSLAFSLKAKYLLSSNTWGCVKVWDMLEREETQESAFAKGECMHGGWLAFASDAGRFSSSFGAKRSTLVRQLPSGKILDRVPFPAEISWMNELAMSPDGSTLAFLGGKERKIGERPLNRLIMYDLAGRKTRYTREMQDGASDASFTPDGKLVGVVGAKGPLALGWDQTPPYILRLYDVQNGRLRSTIIVTQTWAKRFVFTSDSKRAAVLCKEGLKIFELSTGAQMLRIGSEAHDIESFAFYPASQFLFTGHADGAITDSSGRKDTLFLWTCV